MPSEVAPKRPVPVELRWNAIMGRFSRWGIALSLLVLGLGFPFNQLTDRLGSGADAGGSRIWLEVGALLVLSALFALPWVISRWWYTLSLPAWVPPFAYLLVSVGPVVAVLAGAKGFGRFFYQDTLRFFHQPEVFADLVNVTGAWECGLQNTGDANMCDPFGRPYIYPSALLLVGRLGITSSWLVPLGLLLAAGVAVALWLLARRATTAGRMTLALFGVSPTLILLTERANIEALLLPALLSAAWVGGRKTLPALLAILIIGAAALTKFLPAVALLATPLAAPRQMLIRFSFGVLTFAVVGWLMFGDIGVVEAPNYLTTSFGLPNLLALLSGAGMPTFVASWSAWFMLVLASAIGVMTGISWRTTANFKVAGRFSSSRALSLAGLSVVAAAFVGFSSFDYRLILLALLVPLVNELLIHENRFSNNARLAAAVLALLAIAPLSLALPLVTSSVVLVIVCVMTGWWLADLFGRRARRDQLT